MTKRETYPQLATEDELVIVFRDHLGADREPILRIAGLTGAQVRLEGSVDIDPRLRYQVNDYAATVGLALTITVNGAPTVLTEGVDFQAATSNTNTAQSIAIAVNQSAPLVGLLTAVAFDNTVLFSYTNNVTTFAITSAAPQSVTAFGLFGAYTSVVRGGLAEVKFPLTTTLRVFTLKITQGRISVDLRSPIEVRSYLRLPGENRGTTGDSGGWPNAITPLERL